MPLQSASDGDDDDDDDDDDDADDPALACAGHRSGGVSVENRVVIILLTEIRRVQREKQRGEKKGKKQSSL